jgi:tetratricopeptide (TPR) repeat protein
MSKTRHLLVAGSLVFVTLLAAYSNHFRNGFYFDDDHTIVTNGYIRDLRNLPEFFLDASTYSTLPANQSYRPVVTTLNAIDYALAGHLNPIPFHISIFTAYVVQLLLMLFMFRGIMDRAQPRASNGLFALFAVAAYGLHTANAETINYITARSDSFSTLCIVAAMFLYQAPKTRKHHIYLVPMVLGIYTKQTGVMFAPLLFLYIWFFEQDEPDGVRGLLVSAPKALRRSAPAILLSVSLFVVNQFFFTPMSTVSMSTEASRWDYFFTQFYVVTHYLANFFVPVRLSADPDFVLITRVVDFRILFGIVVVSGLLALAGMAAKTLASRPIAFGILWFFVALLPTSSVVPLYQMANDHRTFFPYIGLVLSLSWLFALLKEEARDVLERRPSLRVVFPALAGFVLCVHAYGAHQRNEVWSSSETLWHDVTVKSPENARGQMNYGVALMGLGRYAEALVYLERARTKLPFWTYTHVNLGILRSAMGYPQEAESHFRDALVYGSNVPEPYVHYARWLRSAGRNAEAEELVRKAISLSPEHVGANSLLTELVASDSLPTLASLEDDADREPTPERYLKLSHAYYNAGRYSDCIRAAESALSHDPGYPYAYNNICSARIKLGEWDKAIDACERALEIAPNYELARNNLRWAMQEKDAARKP